MSRRLACPHNGTVYAVRAVADHGIAEDAEALVCSKCGGIRRPWTHYPAEFFVDKNMVSFVYPEGAALEILAGPASIADAEKVAQKAHLDKIRAMPGRRGAELRLRWGMATSEEAKTWERVREKASEP